MKDAGAEYAFLAFDNIILSAIPENNEKIFSIMKDFIPFLQEKGYKVGVYFWSLWLGDIAEEELLGEVMIRSNGTPKINKNSAKQQRETAFQKLLEMVHAYDDHIDVGMLGGRVLFHVLARFGYSDLAFKMITREDYPSFGIRVKIGATTLWEKFQTVNVSSMNHPTWGDISGWFIKCLAGIRLNPNKNNVNELLIQPSFITALDHASAYHIAPAGKIGVSWKREGNAILLKTEIPEGICATAVLEPMYSFQDGQRSKPITSGSYQIIQAT